jgi:hypothetical protein
MSSASMPARSSAAFIVTLAIVAAWLFFKLAPKAPIAVRQAEAITTSVIFGSFVARF